MTYLGQDSAGITPAYAGSMAAPPILHGGTRDHPRIRGEHAAIEHRAALIPGSPPHTRGASHLIAQLRFQGGITPAYAGSIMERQFSRASRLGSPPHTRGAFD